MSLTVTDLSGLTGRTEAGRKVLVAFGMNDRLRKYAKVYGGLESGIPAFRTRHEDK